MSELAQRHDWLNGPSWLKLPRDLWPVSRNVGAEGCAVEETPNTKAKATITLAATQPVDDLDQILDCRTFSNYDKLIRVTAWILRFIRNMKDRATEKRIPAPEIRHSNLHDNKELDAAEYENSEKLWFRYVQNSVKVDPHISDITKSLGLYTDNEGIMRCTGRLRKSNLSMEAKFPIILPRLHHLTNLIIIAAHEKVFHNGLKETLTQLRSRFWIIKGRQKVKQVIRPCVLCKRLEGKPYPDPEQAALPVFRVTGSKAFHTTGLDYFGPLYIKSGHSRHPSMIESCALHLRVFTNASPGAHP
jgi:hypothetical protein